MSPEAIECLLEFHIVVVQEHVVRLFMERVSEQHAS